MTDTTKDLIQNPARLGLLALILGVLALVGAVGCQEPPRKVRETHTLEPEASKRITFESTSDKTVSFNPDLSEAERKVIEKGLRVTQVNAKGEGEVFTSKGSIHIKVPAEEGKISLLVENLEKIILEELLKKIL